MSYKRTSPLPIVEGGTNATSMATTDGTAYYDGTRIVTTATGTSGLVLVSNGAGVAPTYQVTPSASGTIVTKFTGSGTWTINASTKWVDVYIWGGGGGGGSGAQNIDSNGSGGGGGGGAGPTYQRAPAQAFNAGGETVTIGGGGTGGLAQASINTDGNPGGAVTISSLGNIVTRVASSVAAGGTALGGSGAPGGTGGLGIILSTLRGGTAGGDGDNTVANPNGAASAGMFGQTGGGGGGYCNAVTPQSGGNGGLINLVGSSATLIAGGIGGTSGGTIDGTDGNPGAASNIDIFSGGTGGGGGGGQSAAGGLVVGKGGKGGIPGGGGGGGGASINGISSGAGGDGARGEIWVVEYK